MLFDKRTFSLKDTSLFSDLFKDYIEGSEKVKPFYSYHIHQSEFKSYLLNNTFESVNRVVLVNALETQASLVSNTSDISKANISLLKKQTTFSVTTGHQLCVATGPLYFIYKIISTINLCKALQLIFPDKNFVPVYWMASEDHDFEEINHVNIFGKKLVWNSIQKGSVGEFSTEGLREMLAEMTPILGESVQAKSLMSILEEAYIKHQNLADATRYLVNELFGEYGIVTLDGNDKNLKKLFTEEFKADVFENKSYALVNETIQQLKPAYAVQVNPREINVFYKEKGIRERIEQDGAGYKVVNTDIRFSKEELESLIENKPEQLSPNVVLRPLYQQKILPNIAYVGGPGEIAYWLEYKALFEAYQISFPVLMPRNFVMLLDKNTQSKLQKLDIPIQDIFKDGEELVRQLIKTQHTDVNLEDAKKQLTDVFLSITQTVSQIDKSLIASTEAEKQKSINGLSTIEQKINRALKQKSETDINQIWAMKQKQFPNNIPQERYDNFSMYYSKFGKEFISELVEQLTYDLKSFEYTVLLEK